MQLYTHYITVGVFLFDETVDVLSLHNYFIYYNYGITICYLLPIGHNN